ncbi:acyltransferase family protein [Streptococcus ruminantium]|uniref:acyltransferase family protein n=1 Tax=Streptococcus ruminantium TaxID=1917441 RepID=UPI001F31DAE2|nr:acyltransferase family protein [Streptococcus ruminantium]
MGEGMILTQKESQVLKGIAILLMLFHHLFAFKERIPNDMVFSDLTVIIAKFGNLCVPIFLFISGYGLAKINKRTHADFGNRIKKFFLHYWLVFLVFVPLCLLAGNIEITPLNFIFNLFALKTTYNGEWWFATLYTLLLLVVPYFYRLSSKSILILTLSITVAHFILYRVLPAEILYFIPNFTPTIAFGLGFITVRIEPIISKNLENYLKKFDNPLGIMLLCTIFLLLVIIGARVPSFMNIACPVYILYLKHIYKIINVNWLEGLLVKLGNRSLFMWLTHSFYCYKLIPHIIYFTENAIIIFLLLVFISYMTAVVLEWLYRLLFKFFNWRWVS